MCEECNFDKAAEAAAEIRRMRIILGVKMWNEK
jgi:hypothetical protein